TGGTGTSTAFRACPDISRRLKACSSSDAGGGARSKGSDMAGERQATPASTTAAKTARGGIESDCDGNVGSSGGGGGGGAPAAVVEMVRDDSAEARFVPVPARRREGNCNPAPEDDEEKGKILGEARIGTQTKSDSESDSFDPSEEGSHA
ncbi:unnamed protein product, partial [Scytosiphon promiscuus]